MDQGNTEYDFTVFHGTLIFAYGDLNLYHGQNLGKITKNWKSYFFCDIFQ